MKQLNGVTQRDRRVRLTKVERIKSIYMPLVVVLLTASLGTGIGTWLQNRSFRKNELFKARLERIMADQAEAKQIVREVDEARRQIRSNEEFIRAEIDRQNKQDDKENARRYYLARDTNAPSIEILKESKVRLDALGNYTWAYHRNDGVSHSVADFSQELGEFLDCLKNKVTPEENCSDQHPKIMESLRGVVTSYSKMADDLIREYE